MAEGYELLVPPYGRALVGFYSSSDLEARQVFAGGTGG